MQLGEAGSIGAQAAGAAEAFETGGWLAGAGAQLLQTAGSQASQAVTAGSPAELAGVAGVYGFPVAVTLTASGISLVMGYALFVNALTGALNPKPAY
jgi:hypothetical protein